MLVCYTRIAHNLTQATVCCGESAGQFTCDDICCEVRGGFGEDEDDRFMPDTRWLMLSELVQNIDRTELKKLDKFAKKLAKTLETAQAQLEQQARDDAPAAGLCVTWCCDEVVCVL